jgi:hypothetical protein
MSKSIAFVYLISAATFCAQTAPTSYTIAQTTRMIPGGDVIIYRSGSKVVVSRGITKTFYDLNTHRSFSWNTAFGNCGSGTFTGDWGDPFAESKGIADELTQRHAKPAGTETIAAIPASVYVLETEADKIKAWFDPKTGLLLKSWIMGRDGARQTMLEVTSVKYGEPPAAELAMHPSCAGVAGTPPPPTEEQRIEKATGESARNFSQAMMPPASSHSCTVLVKVCRAGSMEQLTSGFQAAVDRNVDYNHPPHYVTGINQEGHSRFSGGSIQDMTPQVRNGVLRIDNAPERFHIDVVFTHGATASVEAYRQCANPQTVLMLVVSDPEQTNLGADWLWVKTGKFAK